MGAEPASTRENATSYDEALVISPHQRLESDREYTIEEIEAIGVDFVLITKTDSADLQQVMEDMEDVAWSKSR